MLLFRSELLARIARAHRPAVVAPRQPQERSWDDSPVELDGTRDEIVALLRAAWFMLEAMGLASLAPERLQQAVEHSTVFSSGTALESFV